MDITKYPQFELYLLTLHLLMLKDQLVPDGCDPRCINSTVINRAYFSSYLYCLLWLEEVKKFKPIPVLNLNPDERISEHQQVRNALSNFGEGRMTDELSKLAKLIKKPIMTRSLTSHQTKSLMPFTIWRKSSTISNSSIFFLIRKISHSKINIAVVLNFFFK